MTTRQGFDNFITRKGDQLFDGENLYKFVSWNVPNIHMIEDPSWHLPDIYEQEDAFKAVDAMKGQVIRTYVLSIEGGVNNAGGIKRSHIIAPGVYDEELFVCLDRVFALAHQYGIRIIFPFIDQASWWGGIGEFAKMRGKSKDEFWTDAEVRNDFKDVIRFLLNRVNTITHIPYKEDKALMCWETGNEIASATDDWTRDIAKFIKSIDQNHLIMDGNDHPNSTALTCNDIDIVTSHYYNYSDDTPFVTRFRRDLEKTNQIKPFVVGEYGCSDFEDMKALTEAVAESTCSGSLIWSLRFRNKEGGFYFHEDGNKPVTSKSYHYPGFEQNSFYYEKEVIQLINMLSHQVQRLEFIESLPDTPLLFPIVQQGELTWRGTTYAINYQIERSETVEGPWIILSSEVNDCFEYGPIYTDKTFDSTVCYWYRVCAINNVGKSFYSNMEMSMVSLQKG